MGGLRRAWRWLTTPATVGADPLDQRRGRMLASALVVAIPLGVLGVWLRFGDQFQILEAAASLVGIAVLGLAYALCMNRGVWAAGWAAAVAACGSGFALLVVGEYDPLLIAYMGLSIVLAGVVLPLRDLALVLGLNTGAFLLVPVLSAEDADLELPAASSYLFLLGSIVVLGVWFRRRQLMDSERRYRDLFGTMFGALAVVRDRAIAHANQAFADMFETSADELIGMPVADLFAADSSSIVRAVLERPFTRNVFAHGTRSDGTVSELELIGHMLPYEGRPAVFLAVRDVGRQRELERQVSVSQRAASLGTLAASVAHDINNPLAFVTTNLQFVNERLSRSPGAPGATADQDIANAIRESIEGAERIRAIAADLSTFSRPDSDAPGPTDVHAALELAIRMTRNEVRHRAQLERAFGEVPPVYATPARLGQVLVNLLVNAAQAIPEGSSGEIRVETDRAEDGRVVIRVCDDGEGIPERLQGKIFDPYFTTKGDHEGTGLGLPICRDIVTSLGGEIRCESVVGKGTTFSVYLRATQADAAGAPALRSRAPERGEPARVLIIDDEPLIAEGLRRTLSGQKVTVVQSGAEALPLCRKHAYDVILCDLMMPEMDGPRVYEEIMAIDPDLASKIVFMSGGAFTTSAQRFIERVSNPVLRKPFSPSQVRDLVADVVGHSLVSA